MLAANPARKTRLHEAVLRPNRHFVFQGWQGTHAGTRATSLRLLTIHYPTLLLPLHSAKASPFSSTPHQSQWQQPKHKIRSTTDQQLAGEHQRITRKSWGTDYGRHHRHHHRPHLTVAESTHLQTPTPAIPIFVLNARIPSHLQLRPRFLMTDFYGPALPNPWFHRLVATVAVTVQGRLPLRILRH